MSTILLVDDEYCVVESLRYTLKDNYKVISASNGRDALKILDKVRVDLMMLDLRMHEMDGLELLRRLQTSYQEIGVIVLTAVSDVKSVVEAIKLGALDYIVKPFEIEEVRLTIDKALQMRSLTKDVRYLGKESGNYTIDKLLHGSSKAMKDIIDIVSRISKVDTTVLLRGESGTGKELVARSIHFDSNRRENPFVVVSCPNLASELLEAELFGYEKGSFTGAYERRLGKFEIAEGGTIFLDEISEISLPLQAKLLRVLQEKEFSRVGSHSVIKTNVRIIAATNKDLEGMIRDGRFREDLYYRINVVPIYLPPLRERKDDIPQLAEHFLNIFRKECHAKIETVSSDVTEELLRYHWPGNIRELKNMIERIVALYGNEPVIRLEHLPVEIRNNSWESISRETVPDKNNIVSLEDEVARIERQLIERALQEAGGIKSKAAKLLGTTRRIINYKIQKHGIADPGT